MNTRDRIEILTKKLHYNYAQIEEMAGIGKGYLSRAIKRNESFKKKTQDKIIKIFQNISIEIQEVLDDIINNS